jgi:transposase
VHTANNVTKFLAKNNIRTLQHPPYSPDLAPADYFLFRRLKSDLAGVSVTPETFKTELERCYGVSAKTSLPKPSRGGYIVMKSA